jgi:hypothetical protein
MVGESFMALKPRRCPPPTQLVLLRLCQQKQDEWISFVFLRSVQLLLTAATATEGDQLTSFWIARGGAVVVVIMAVEVTAHCVQRPQLV